MEDRGRRPWRWGYLDEVTCRWSQDGEIGSIIPRPRPHRRATLSSNVVSNEITRHRAAGSPTYLIIVGCLFFLVALLVCFGLGLIWLALFLVQCLPSLAEDLADLA